MAIQGFNNIKSKPLSSLSGRFNLSATKLGQDFFGDIRLGDRGGSGTMRLEGTKNRIIVYDSNDVPVILIGYQKNGF